jgi:hypothetical protein
MGKVALASQRVSGFGATNIHANKINQNARADKGLRKILWHYISVSTDFSRKNAGLRAFLGLFEGGVVKDGLEVESLVVDADKGYENHQQIN